MTLADAIRRVRDVTGGYSLPGFARGYLVEGTGQPGEPNQPANAIHYIDVTDDSVYMADPLDGTWREVPDVELLTTGQKILTATL